jgi:hypothetical protein
LTKNRNKNLCLKKSSRRNIYYKALSRPEKSDFDAVAETRDFDAEISLLKVKIKRCLLDDPSNLKAVSQAVVAVARLIEIRERLSKSNKSHLKETLANLVKDVTVPLGLAAITKKL